MFYVCTVQDKLHQIFFMLEITSAGTYRGGVSEVSGNSDSMHIIISS